MAWTLCIDCGTPTPRTRCPDCARTHNTRRNTSRPQYAGGWDKHSRDTRAKWVAEHGLVCPGWQVPPHPIATIADLALDHDVGPLCRRCNGRKGGCWDKHHSP